MDDINNKSRGSGKFRFTEPGKTTANLSSPEIKTPKQNLKRPEPLIHEGFRDLYKPAKKPKKPKVSKKKKPKKTFRKKFLVLPLVIVILAAGAIAWYGLKPENNQPKTALKQSDAQTVEPKTEKLTGNFRILASGDIITHDSVYQNAKKSGGGYDFAPMLSEIKPIFEKAQTRICHNTVPAAGGNISGFPSFNAPKELIAGFSASGCNVLSLASDHINDKGQAAIDATVLTIEKNKDIVIHAGANRSVEEQTKPRYFNVGDGLIKFAYFSYTTRQNNSGSSTFGVDVYEKAKVKSQIQQVQDTADLVLVSICWGKEDNGEVQANQETLAQELADAGVDVVFGHCPHVIQPVKKLKSSDGSRETIIYYSLGNALNTQLSLENLIGGLAVVDFDMEAKKITNFGFMPTYMHYEWTAAEKASRKLEARKNLKLYPLDKASAALAKSQNNTTLKAQTDYVEKVLHKFIPAKIYTSAELTN